jgi:hypothetical protein
MPIVFGDKNLPRELRIGTNYFSTRGRANDFKEAVNLMGILLKTRRWRAWQRLAECNSAIQQITNLRYDT